MARHKARWPVRRVACLVLLITAALVIWGAAVTAARRCEDSPVRVNCHGQSTPVTRGRTTVL